MSISRKGKKPTDAARAAQSLAMIGRKVSVETREKIGAPQRGVKRQPCSEELKEQNSLRMIGKKWTTEQIAKRVSTRKAGCGYAKSDEARAKMSASHKGKKISPEVIAKRKATRARNTAIKAAQLQQAFQR